MLVTPRINRIRLEFKVLCDPACAGGLKGLIESDWNLKSCYLLVHKQHSQRINRIRLEFKVIPYLNQNFPDWRINRIRLEFKVYLCCAFLVAKYWINRIRLEFKAV